MFAVVRTGGKQVRVEPGASIRIEKLSGEVGDDVTLADVLLVGDDESCRIGTPTVDGASVIGKITAQGRGPKLRVFKMKRRKGARTLRGHRQSYTEVLVDRIEG